MVSSSSSSSVSHLSRYEEKEEQFKEQGANLRDRFFRSIEWFLLGIGVEWYLHQAFSLSAPRIWKVIKENRDLDLLAHKEWRKFEETVHNLNQCLGLGGSLPQFLMFAYLIAAGEDKSVVLWSIHDHLSSLAANQGAPRSLASKVGAVNDKPTDGSLFKRNGFSKGMKILLRMSSLLHQDLLIIPFTYMTINILLLGGWIPMFTYLKAILLLSCVSRLTLPFLKSLLVACWALSLYFYLVLGPFLQ